MPAKQKKSLPYPFECPSCGELYKTHETDDVDSICYWLCETCGERWSLGPRGEKGPDDRGLFGCNCDDSGLCGGECEVLDLGLLKTVGKLA